MFVVEFHAPQPLDFSVYHNIYLGGGLPVLQVVTDLRINWLWLDLIRRLDVMIVIGCMYLLYPFLLL